MSVFKIRSPTLRLKACRERGRGNGTAAGPTRGGTTPRQERSSAITPASATAAGNSVTPSQPVPVDPHPPGRARRLLSSNRSAYGPNSLYIHTYTLLWYSLLIYMYVLFPQYGSTVVKAGPATLPSGSTTPGRGRRQLPQTPLTPRPAVTYKSAHPSPLPSSLSTTLTGHQTRFSRGLSEHERLVGVQGETLMPVTCIGSDPNLNRQPEVAPQQDLLEETEDYHDTVSSHGVVCTARTTPVSTTASVSQGTAAAPITSPPRQGRAGAMPNGYHFTLGVNSASGPGSRGTGSLREREEEDWC